MLVEAELQDVRLLRIATPFRLSTSMQLATDLLDSSPDLHMGPESVWLKLVPYTQSATPLGTVRSPN